MLQALDRHTVRQGSTDDPGRVVVLDLSRAPTRRFDTVFVLGLEEGALPRRGRGSPFLDDDLRAALGGRLERPDAVERDRYLFYTACTRPRTRLVLVREGANDEGSPDPAEPVLGTRSPRSSSPTTSRGGRVGVRSRRSRGRWRRRRPSASGCVRSRVSRPTTATAARGLAAANGWLRRLDRAQGAFERETRLLSPANLDWLAQRTTFGVTELERFADCSSAWLFERLVSPRTIDAEPDAMLRGQVAHTALHRFYQALPKELGVDTPDARARGEGRSTLIRRCLDDALASGVRIDLTGLQAAELRAGAAARPRGVRPRRGRLGAPARPATPRGGLRLRPGRARAPARPPARRRPDAVREDRPHRHRPVQRQRHRPGLQVGQGRALRPRHRARDAPADPALHARPARPRRASSPSAASTGRSRASGRRAGCCARRRADQLPGFQQTRLPRRRGVLGPGRDRARARGDVRAADPGGRRAPRPEGRRLPLAGATSGRCAGWSAHETGGRACDDGRGGLAPERGAARRRRGDRGGLRLGRRGHRQDLGARRALRPRRRASAGSTSTRCS